MLAAITCFQRFEVPFSSSVPGGVAPGFYISRRWRCVDGQPALDELQSGVPHKKMTLQVEPNLQRRTIIRGR